MDHQIANESLNASKLSLPVQPLYLGHTPPVHRSPLPYQPPQGPLGTMPSTLATNPELQYSSLITALRAHSFLKITSAPNSGSGQVINYSKRFTLSGMTGVWPAPAIQQAYLAAAGSVDSVPATQNTVVLGAGAGAGGGAGGAPGADGPFGVSYQFQTTGLTKYAPMQPKPGTKITATHTAPLFAPSPFTVATTFLPVPSLVTTITQAVTYSVSSRENTVCIPPSSS